MAEQTPTASGLSTPVGSDVSSSVSSAPRRASSSEELWSADARLSTPRLYVRTPRRAASSNSLPPLLQMNASVNGRLGLATSTTLIISAQTLSYGRYEIPLVEIEQAVCAGT